MKAKADEMQGLEGEVPDLSVQVFAGEQAGNMTNALAGAPVSAFVASD